MTELKGEAREVALAEVQAVRALTSKSEYDELLAQIDEGTVADEELLESLLELGIQSGRIRAYYGPGGEQAVIATLRRLPRGRERAQSTIEVSAALTALSGKMLHGVSLTAVGPGAFALTIDAGGLETSLRLDRNGARLTSVGT